MSNRNQPRLESSDLESRVRAVGELLSLFKLERLLYLVTIVVSLIILLIGVVALIIRNGLSDALIVAIFGPAGVIVVMTGRLLKMWNDATRLVGRRDEK